MFHVNTFGFITAFLDFTFNKVTSAKLWILIHRNTCLSRNIITVNYPNNTTFNASVMLPRVTWRLMATFALLIFIKWILHVNSMIDQGRF